MAPKASLLLLARADLGVTMAIMGARLPLLCILVAACSCGAADLPRCDSIHGSDLLWSRSGIAFVLVGEMHGTTETPAIFADLVCSAKAAKRPIVVGIERPVAEQDAINAFMDAGKHAAAVDTLLAQTGWHKPLDGRSSRAMLALLEELRAMKAQRTVTEVVAFDAARPDEPAAKREERMAGVLTGAASRYPGALVIALSGNLHPSKGPLSHFGYPMMGTYLPAAATVSLLVADLGGEAWYSDGKGCEPHKLGSTAGSERGITMSGSAAPMRGYDGVLSTGAIATASPPAISDPPSPPACSN